MQWVEEEEDGGLVGGQWASESVEMKGRDERECEIFLRMGGGIRVCADASFS